MIEIIEQPAGEPGQADHTQLHDCRSPLHDCYAGAVLQDCHSSGVAAPSVSAVARAALRPHPLLKLLPLDAEYAAAFVPSLSRVAVLGRGAVDLLRRLPLAEHPGTPAELAAIDRLWRFRLLSDGPAALPTPPEASALTAWMHITNACNLRCGYCYLHKTHEAMSAATARQAVDTIVRSALAHGYPAVAIKYAGGEASLRIDTVALAHSYAQEQCARHGLALSAGLLSNGTALTAARLATIQRLGLGLMISLDGLPAEQNANRPTVTGKGSARAVFAGIERARAAGVPLNIAVTVTGASVGNLPRLIDWLLARELHFTISFYRENDCSAPAADLRVDEQRIVEGMRRVYGRVERRPPRWSLLSALLDRTDLAEPHRRACAAGHSYLVIDHHGRIAACQMTIGHPVTSLADPDPLTTIRLHPGRPRSLTADEKEGCRDCEWRYWCAGGCAVATYRATGRYDVQSPNCNIYRALYPDVIRLEGLRLLHWHRQRHADPAV